MNPFDVSNKADSRKLRVVEHAAFLLVGSWLLINWFPVLADSYSILATGIVSLVGLYVGANVGNKLVVGKNINAATQIALANSEPVSRASANLPGDDLA